MSYTKEEKKENAAFNFKFFNFKVLRKRTFFFVQPYFISPAVVVI